jgi:hypothetical protein
MRKTVAPFIGPSVSLLFPAITGMRRGWQSAAREATRQAPAGSEEILTIPARRTALACRRGGLAAPRFARKGQPRLTYEGGPLRLFRLFSLKKQGESRSGRLDWAERSRTLQWYMLNSATIAFVLGAGG